MSLTALHTADWHHSDQWDDITGPAIENLVKQAQELKPSIITIAGDLILKRGHMSPNESYVLRNAFLEMADIAPVIVIPGNHDISNRYDRVDAVTGLLSRMRMEHPTLHERIYVSVRPGVVEIPVNEYRRGGHTFGYYQIYALPHPSKYIYLAQDVDIDPAQVNTVLTTALQEIVAGHGAHASMLDPSILKIMVGHGTIAGGLTDSEMVMTTENDLAIDRTWLPTNMDAIMYGHLHGRQQVGEGFFCGAIAPFTWGQQNMVPSFEMWEFPDNAEAVHSPIEIPVSHQLLTVEVKQDAFVGELDPTAVVMAAVEPVSVKNAKVRVRVEIPREKAGLFDKTLIEARLIADGVHSQKVVTDTIEPLKVRAEKITQENGMAEMLDVWSELDDDRVGSLEMMKEIDQNITNLIPAEQLFKLQGIDYQITRIRATNFKPLIDIDLEFDKLGKVICIVGDNHIGKSQLAEIERFGLWKKLRNGTLLPRVVRLGTKSATVIIDFISGKDKYQVKRIVKLDGRGSASSDVVLSKKFGETFSPLNEGTSDETQELINQKVGTYGMYRATRFGSQRDIDLLCSMKPAELKDTLQEAMNFTQFDLRREAASSELTDLRSKYENATMNLERLQTQANQEPDLLQSIEDSEAAKATKTAEISGFQKQIAEIEVKIDRVGETATEITQLNNAIAEKDRQIAAENTAITAANAALGQVEEAKAGLALIEELKTKIETLQNEQHEINNEIHTDNLKLEEARIKFNTVKDIDTQLREDRQVITSEITNKTNLFATTAKSMEADLERATRVAKLAEEVPCAGMDIHSTCQLLTDANKATGEKISIQTKLDEFKSVGDGTTPLIEQREEIDRKGATNKEAMTIAQGVIDQIEPGIKSKQLDVNTKMQAAGTARGKLQTEQAKNWGAVQEQILVAQTNINNANTNISRLEDEKFEFNRQLVNLPKDDTDTTLLNSSLASLRSNLEAVQGQQEQSVRQLGALQQNLEAVQEVKRQIADLNEVNATGLAKINAYVHYLAAVSRDGIPYLLMEKALPQFEHYANEFLCVDEGFDTDLRVQISAVKDTQSGKAKNEVVITFIDELGQHPLSESSGFQRIAIGYALRASMAKIQAVSTGITIRHCIFDEGWGTFKENNHSLAQRMIQKLSEAFGQFFYITHIPALQEVADTIIHVIAADCGAEIKIAA